MSDVSEAAIDLRSDTVTQPTPAMRDAIATAEVGDDVYGEDPSINALEEAAAAKLGKEAAVYVPSGTMANLICLMTHCEPGDQVILGDQAHILRVEGGGFARVAGLFPAILPNDADGSFDPALVGKTVQAAHGASPRTTLVALENTHNFCGGRVVPQEQIDAIAATAHDLGIRTHMDGARIFNAEVASGVPAAEIAKSMDSVTFCLSKGLSCPVGSLVCGDADFIERARRNRKFLGGSMRQAGVVAVAGVVALETMIDRLADDHANAKRLARGLAELGWVVQVEAVDTNIVVAEVADARGLVAELAEGGVLITVLSDTVARFVTHYGIEQGEIDEALSRVEATVKVPA